MAPQEQLITQLNHIDELLHLMREQLGKTAKIHTDPHIILKRTAGALRHAIKGDLTAWQRRIRTEWE